MNKAVATKKLNEGGVYTDQGQQRFGVVYENKVVFEVKFPVSSPLESFHSVELADMARKITEIILDAVGSKI